MRSLIYVFAMMLAACVTTSDITPIGGGRYLLVGHASGGLNAGKGAGAAAQKAAAFCASQGKTLFVTDTELHGIAALGGESTNMTFICEDPKT
jgi:gamma-glutamyltranspeptidase